MHREDDKIEDLLELLCFCYLIALFLYVLFQLDQKDLEERGGEEDSKGRKNDLRDGVFQLR